MLKAIHIKKSFEDAEVLTDVNLTIEPGKITVLTGYSGSGKSTLLRCLSLLDSPDSGEIIVDDDCYMFPNSKTIHENKLYPKITCVFQQLYLWPHLSNRANIELALKLQDPTAIIDINYYIEVFGMKKFIDKFPNESSLGQRQRAALVRAMVLKTKYLLLDEITSALDPKNIVTVLSELLRYSQDDVGILLVSHDSRVVSNNEFLHVFLDNGKLHTQSPPVLPNNPT